MVGLFGQVWVFCVVSFLAGAAVTWLVFVREARPPQPAPLPATEMARWAPEPEPPPRPAPVVAPPQPAVEPALANLDTHRDHAAARHAGSVAAGALDRLGVAGAPRAAPDPASGAPEIPEQAGPVDARPASDER
ncbi:MAG TPA: hypothetical protein VD903_06400 [Pseudonocardia sp.]|nr:hypothetical protein [Pseudonocardia sp.]